MMARVTFLLPGGAGRVVGGIKVVLEQANRLARDGYSIVVVMPMSLNWHQMALKDRCRVIGRSVKALLCPKFHYPHRWFLVDKRVRFRIVPSLSERFVPVSDIYIATSVETAEYLAQYSGVDSRHKLYYIQAYEDWSVGRERLLRSYSLPLTKIVIAMWLKEIVESTGSCAELIENGFNFDEFYITLPIEQKARASVAMLLHPIEAKGCADGLRALEIVKCRYPQLRAQVFGVEQPQERLSDWIEFHHNPSRSQLLEIYNSSSIFLATSHHEGWGLTVGEAMMCGAAVVCTSCGGYRTMATHSETALVVPIKSPTRLADGVVRLIEDDALRVAIARRANQNIRRFTWERSYSKFKSIIEKVDK